MKKSDAFKSVLLMAVGVIAVGGGLVYWQWTVRSDAETRVSSLESQLPDAQQLQADLDKSMTELADYQAKLDHLESGIPSTAYIPTLLAELEQVGMANNIQVTGVRPVMAANTGVGETTEPKDYDEIEIDITGKGSYGSVMDLIAALQIFPKILAVKTVGLAPRPTTAGEKKELDATVRLRAFVFKDADKAASEDEEPTEVASAQSGVNSL